MFERAPSELIGYLSNNFLDEKSTLSAMQVSRGLYNLFSIEYVWKAKIEKDFGIKPDQFIPNLNQIKDKQKFYKNFYKHLYCLKENYHRMPRYLQYIFDNKKHSLLPIIYSDDVAAIKNIPCEEHDTLAKLAIFACCKNIPRHFFDKEKQDEKKCRKFLDISIQAGCLDLISYLLNADSHFGLTPDINSLKNAAINGHLHLVQYFLDPQNEFGIQPNHDVLTCATNAKNTVVLSYLLDKKNNFELTPNQNTVKAVKSQNTLCFLLENKFVPSEFFCLSAQVRKGHFEIIKKYLADKFKKMPDKYVLDEAAASGSFELFLYLLNSYPELNKSIDIVTLGRAAYSGSLEIVDYLLSHFHLMPTQKILNEAAQSRNLTLFYYLIEKFPLTPNQETLKDAILFNSTFIFNVVRYLVEHKNQFNLTFDIKMLNTIAEKGEFDLFCDLLENQSGLKPNDETLGTAIYSNNLDLVRYLLDPKNNFELNSSDQNLEFCENAGITDHLIPSEIAIKKGFIALEYGQFEIAKKLLREAHHLCPSHYEQLIAHAHTSDNPYHLTPKAKQILLDLDYEFSHLKEATASRMSCSKS